MSSIYRRVRILVLGAQMECYNWNWTQHHAWAHPVEAPRVTTGHVTKETWKNHFFKLKKTFLLYGYVCRVDLIHRTDSKNTHTQKNNLWIDHQATLHNTQHGNQVATSSVQILPAVGGTETAARLWNILTRPYDDAMRAVPKASARSTGTRRNQHPRHKP